MCDESGCCGFFGPYRNFALGYFICLGIIAAVTIIVVLLLGYGHVFPLKIAVDDASLTRFALNTSPTTSISYNLTLSLTVHNRNWAMSATYRSLEADYLFDRQRFDRVTVVPSGYVQPAKKTAVFHLNTGADAAYAALGSAGVQEYRKESGKGVFDIEVDLSGEVKYQLHQTWCMLEAKCPLKLQLATPDAGSTVFQKTTCDLLRSSQRGC